MGSLYSCKQNNASKSADITIKDQKEKNMSNNCFTFAMDINIFVKEHEKLSQYKDLYLEVERV